MRASCETALVCQPSDKRVAACKGPGHLARLAHTVIKQIGRNPDRNSPTTVTVNRELGSDSLGHSPMGPYIGRGEGVPYRGSGRANGKAGEPHLMVPGKE
jgi:hypothetical protein